jgi:hypothetical protein
MELLETYPWEQHSKQTVTKDKTNGTLQGDSYPIHLAEIKGEQVRGRQFRVPSSKLKVQNRSERRKIQTTARDLVSRNS